MSASVFTPVNQIRLTNVAVVRYKKGGKRFELACYKNKVGCWRKKNETNLEEVLQTHTIFTNVSKGEVASQEDLQKSFKAMDENQIILHILEKGELQVSQKERELEMNSVFKKIVTTISNRTIDPNTKRPYPISIIETALRQTHFSIKPQKVAKSQVSEAIKLIQDVIPIERVQMKVQINFPLSCKPLKELIIDYVNSVEQIDINSDFELICLIDPGKWRGLNDLIQSQTKGKAHLELLNYNTIESNDLSE